MMKPISVAARLPPEGERAMAYDSFNEYWRDSFYSDQWFYWEGGGDIVGSESVTHWLPMLPAPDSAAWRECETGEGE